MPLVAQAPSPTEQSSFTRYRGSAQPTFATRHEAECAAALDANNIAWEHAPIEFVIVDELGAEDTFRPSLYLPDLNMFVETNASAGRIERLIRQHPDVDIRMFHPHDLGELSQRQRDHDSWALLTRAPLAV